MASQPPRRRRSQRDDRGLPLLPVLLGVVLLGFAVGAVLSMTSARHQETQVVQTQPSPQADITPSPLPTLVRKMHAHPKLTPYPAVVPTIAHSAPPSVEPSVEPTDEPSATVAPTATATPVPIVSEPPVVKIPATPQVEESAQAPTPTPAAVSQSAPIIEVDSEFAQEAAQAVRAYLTALREGDEDAASAQLAPGLSLSEEAFMSRTARITRIHATGTSTDASVQARVVTDQGAYTATFSVERGPKGPVIQAHDFVEAK